MSSRNDDLLIAARALARAVYVDNPEDMTLAEIVSRWGGASEEEVAALARVQHLLVEDPA